MDVRKKLVELISDSLWSIEIACRSNPNINYAPTIADNLMAHGVTVQEWISVNDRLPDESGLVIGYDIVWGVGCFYYHTDMQTSTWQQITHWMPLPQPPKGE